MPAPVVFISHAERDKEAAKKLREWLRERFGDDGDFFVSSDWECIPPGEDWWNRINVALKKCKLGILLATKNSITRPWINYEFGAMSLLGTPVIPLCVGFSKSTLKSPHDVKQALTYDDADEKILLLKAIAKTLGWKEAAIKLLRDSPNAPELKHLLGKADSPRLSEGGSLASHDVGELLWSLFSERERWDAVVYTCRATFTKEACPEKNNTVPVLQKAVVSHIPVDEIRTLSYLLATPPPYDGHEEDIGHAVCCSMRAEEALWLNATLVGTEVTGMLDRNWIIVGENNFGDALLRMMSVYLPWQFHLFERVETIDGVERKTETVSLELAERRGMPRHAAQMNRLTRDDGMLVLFPNPFNVERQVLVLFGCHRSGQFALEQWLRSEEARTIIHDLRASLATNNEHHMAAQVVIKGAPVISAQPGTLHYRAEAVTDRGSDDAPVWCTKLSNHRRGKLFQPNPDCTSPKQIADFSLIHVLPREQQEQLERQAKEALGDTEPFYWEKENCEIGLHITLFEFYTHSGPNSEQKMVLDKLAIKLLDALRNAWSVPSMITARIRQLELLPRSVITYVDFLDVHGHLSPWLDDVRSWCEAAASSALRSLKLSDDDVLNRMQVPFPVHITLCRFQSEFKDEIKERTIEAVKKERYREQFRVPIKELSLALAENSPYRKVQIVETIQLTGTSAVPTRSV